MKIPGWIILWLIVNAILMYIDSVYILVRPQSLKGGSLYWFFWPYENYVKFDTLYGMNSDPFVVIQSWLNTVEASLCFLSVFIYIIGKRSCGAMTAIIVQTMTFWKTVIFLWYDHSWTTVEAKAFTPMSILCYYLPSSFWIIMPFLTIVILGSRFSQSYDKKINEEKKKV